MNCPNCGTQNPDTASICVNCGRPMVAPPRPPLQATTPPPPAGGGYAAPAAPGVAIPNYLVQSILVTLCCCVPFGIVAIVFAAQVNSKLAAGDVNGAMQASRNAKMWVWIAFGTGLLFLVIWMVTGGMATIQGMRDGFGDALPNP